MDERVYRELLHEIKPLNSRGGSLTDFPETSGERERNKFRPVDGYRGLVAVAVTGPTGDEIGMVLVPRFDDLAREIRLLRLALQVKGVCEDLGDLDSESV